MLSQQESGRDSKSKDSHDRNRSNSSAEQPLFKSGKTDARAANNQSLTGKTTREVLASIVEGSLSVRKQQSKFMLTAVQPHNRQTNGSLELNFKRRSPDQTAEIVAA